jgi:hypothetical protein
MGIEMKIASKTTSVLSVKIETTMEGNGIKTITTSLSHKILMIKAAYIRSHFKITIIKEEITQITGSNNNKCQATSVIHHLHRCKISGN